MFGFNSISQKAMEDRLVLTISSSTGNFYWSELNIAEFDWEWHEISNPSNKSQGTNTNYNHVIDFGNHGTYQLKISPNTSSPYKPNYYTAAPNHPSHHPQKYLSRREILSIDNWGNHPFSHDLGNGFVSAGNLDIKASDCPNFTYISTNGTLTQMFQNCLNLKNENGSLGNWNMSKIKNLSYFLSACYNLKEDIDISSWDTSNCTNLAFLFQHCPISSDIPTAIKTNHGKTYIAWDTSNVTTLSGFNTARTITKNNTIVLVGSTIGDITNWNTSKVHNLRGAFSAGSLPRDLNYPSSFNQDISTKHVTIGAGTNLEKSYFAWDVSKVTNFGDGTNYYVGTFYNSIFNQDIGNWEINTGSEVTMQGMFSTTPHFNQDISTKEVTVGTGANTKTYTAWNTEKVTSFKNMFYNRYFTPNMEFNQDISNWDTSNANDMSSMFQYNNSFNQDISSWNTSNVTNMASMFRGSSFTHALSSSYQNHPQRGEYIAWDTSNVIDMSFMFSNALSTSIPYDNNINNWNTSKVRFLKGTFSGNNTVAGTASFNQDISTKPVIIGAGTSVEKSYFAWDVSKVELFGSLSLSHNTGQLFHGTFFNNKHFNQDIGNWEINTGSDVVMRYMFTKSSFNQPIHQKEVTIGTGANTKTYTAWNTEKVINLYATFQESDFNQDIGNWNLKNNLTLERTFYEASSFDQDISNWDTSKNTSLSHTFASCPLTTDLKTKPVTQHGYDYNAWDTSNVTNMNETFKNTLKTSNSYLGYNGDITNWNTSKVGSIRGMFAGVSQKPHQFNQDISTKEVIVGNDTYIAWDVSKVEQFGVANAYLHQDNHLTLGTFSNNNMFNQDIGNWEINTGSEVTMKSMFHNSIFNQPIHQKEVTVGTGANTKTYIAWNTEKVSNFVNTFSESPFNQDISNWDLTSVISTEQMFYRNNQFNQDINTSIKNVGTGVNAKTYNAWYTPNLTNANSMLSLCTVFNQSLDKWYVGNLVNFNSGFSSTNLTNQSFSPQSVTLHGGVNYDSWTFNTTCSLLHLFRNSSNFEGIGLKDWVLTYVRLGKSSSPDFLYGTNLSPNTYNDILINWESQSPTLHPDLLSEGPIHIDFGMGASNATPSTPAAQTAKASLENNYEWTIINA